MTPSNKPASGSKGPQQAPRSGPAPGKRVADSRKRNASQVKINPIPLPATPVQTRRRNLLLGLFGLLAVGLFFNYWLNRTGSITGKIHEPTSSQPLRNARLKLDGEEPVIPGGVTDTFVVNHLKPGHHTLKVLSPGHDPRTLEFELKAGEATDFDIALKPVEVADPLAGPLTIVGSRQPDGIEVLDAQFNSLYKFGFEAWPTDGVANGPNLYLSLTNLDRVAVLDLRDRKVNRFIDLPKLSSPTRLLLSPDKRQLIILNVVGKNLTVVDAQDLSILRTIPLPSAATDMALTPDGGSVVTSGTDSLLNINYSTGTVDTPRHFVSDLDIGMTQLPGTGQILLAGGKIIAVIDATGSGFEEIELADTLTRVAAIDNIQVLVGAGSKLMIYNLAQKQVAGEPYDFKVGEVRRLVREGDKWLVATRSPDSLYLFDLKDLAHPQTIMTHGQVEFALGHSL